MDGVAMSARKRSTEAKLRSAGVISSSPCIRAIPPMTMRPSWMGHPGGVVWTEASERLQHIADHGVGEIAGEALHGGLILTNKPTEILCGLVLLTEGERVVAVKDSAVSRGKCDLHGDGYQIAGGLTGCGVVCKRHSGLRKDSPGKRGIRVGGGIGEDAVAGSGIQLPNDGTGEDKLRVVGLRLRGKDRNCQCPDVRRNVSGGSRSVIPATGEGKDDGGRECEGKQVSSYRVG